MDVGITIQQAIDGFLASHTESTAQSYRTGLNHFASFLAHSGLLAHQESAGALTVDHAVNFIDWLRETVDPARATTQIYLTAVFQFYQYLNWRGAGLGNNNLARLKASYRHARSIRGESRPKDHKLEAVEAVIRTARSIQVQPGPDEGRARLRRLRDIAIVETLRATGCRVGELVGLRVGDLATTGHHALVKGKGSKFRNVYWDETAWTALQAYLSARGQPDGKAPIFVGHSNRSNGNALKTRHVARTIERLGKLAGVEGVTAHYFRHVFATRVLSRTDNLALAQDLLGHASPITTRAYATTDEKQRQAVHAQVWA
jgi:site-specific recombinase XerD